MLSIASIFIAPIKKDPMLSCDMIEAVENHGLRGDRYFSNAGTFTKAVEEGDAGRNLTMIAQETIDAVLREFGIDLSEGRHRRNLVTQGGELMVLLNRKIRIGDVLLRIDRTCPPCGHLKRLVHPKIVDALKNRGGLRATILIGGKLAVGDVISEA